MQRFYGKVTDSNGNPVANARLSVYTENVISPLPPIYKINSDNTISPQANPLLSDSDGQYEFVTGDGNFTVKATGSSAVLNISKTVTQFTPATVSAAPVAVTLNRQVFTSSSSWPCPAGVVQATVTCVGGGAGGRAGSNGVGQGGDGGGGGATVVRTIEVIPGNTYSITIGTGGTAGVPSLGAGGAGGDTKFGTLITANGAPAPGAVTGSPGTGTTAGYGGPIAKSVVADTSQMIFNGRGGICSGGTGREGGSLSAGTNGNSVETYDGGTGGTGSASNGGGGGGGATPFGKGGNGGSNPGVLATGGAGSDGGGYGAGGGGGASGGTTGGAGGKGAPGVCIVEWIS